MKLFWNASKHKDSDKYLQKIRSVVKHMDKKDFNYAKFKSFDWRTNRAFSLPLIRLRNELMNNMLGKSFWKRLLVVINSALSNPDIVLERFTESPPPPKLKQNITLKISPTQHEAEDGAGAVKYYNKGERGFARKDLQKYLSIIYEFRQLIIEKQKLESQIGYFATFASIATYPFRKLGNAIYKPLSKLGRSQKTNGSSNDILFKRLLLRQKRRKSEEDANKLTALKNMTLADLGTALDPMGEIDPYTINKAATAAPEPVVKEKSPEPAEEPVTLTYEIEDALTCPASNLRQNAQDAKEVARRALGRCRAIQQEELLKQAL